jgi:predicted phosphohydrolase
MLDQAISLISTIGDYEMKAVLLSDTHSYHDRVKVPKADIAIFTGDAEIRNIHEAIKFIRWMNNLPVNKVIFTMGNHDLWVEANEYTFGALLPKKLIYLNNRAYKLRNGLEVYGSNFTPEFNDWAFMRPRDEMYATLWSKIPTTTDILLTHGPAYNILDKIPEHFRRNNEDPHVGCKGLTKRITELPNLKYHIFGHIHMEKDDIKAVKLNNVTYINASICNNNYAPINKPVVINLENK